MGQDVDAVCAAKARRERRDGRAQHIHVGIALRQHSPGGIRRDEKRLRREFATLLNPRPEQAQRAEFRHGEKLIGIGAEAGVNHPPCVVECYAGSFQCAQVSDTHR